MENPKVRAVLLFLLGLTFGVLILGGQMINKHKPPIPETVRTPSGETVFTAGDVHEGQDYYFSRGGQHIGTIWGHGSYLAPDWSADFLHRMGLFIAGRHYGLGPEQAGRFTQKDFEDLDHATRARLSALVQDEIRTNRYDAGSGELGFTPYQAEAFQALTAYYTELFQNGNERMGLQPGIVKTADQGRQVTSFFAWLAWAAGTERPDKPYTYTSNWPYDPLVGNSPLPGTVIWSIVSVIILILGIAVALFLYLRYIREEDYESKVVKDFPEPAPTASQKMTLPYFLVAIVLLVAQIGLGAVTAHFTVEGTYFFGIPLAKILPYAAARTWHLQLAVFFIATCFLAAGLFIGPFVGREPKKQGLLVGVLFGAVVVVVLGSLSGTWLSVAGVFGGDGFYLGHQGYEFIELGRVWQLLLIAGMLIWLVLVLRAILPAIRKEEDSGGLTHMLLYSAVSIPLFYMAGLMYGKGSHVSNAEYWRWWVVHLWVEGFFEVFATVVMAFLLARHRCGEQEVCAQDNLLHRLPVSGKRRDRNVSPPLLDRGAHADHRPGRGLLRTGGGPAHPARVRGRAQPPGDQGGRTELCLQVADLLLHLRGLLEPRGRRGVRLPDQPAHRPLLLPGDQHHTDSCPHGHVRCLRPACHIAAALLRAPHRDPAFLVGQAAQVEFLGLERRPGVHGRVQPDPLRVLPVLPCGQVRPVVRPQPGDHLGPRHPCLQLDAAGS